MNHPKYVIVVGIDFSKASERALDEAFAVAATKHGAELHVANVRPVLGEPPALESAPDPLSPWRLWAVELREYVARRAAAFQATAEVAPFRHLYTHQRMNDPARELAQLALDVDADLVVVGTHDWHGGSQVQGSVAEAVTRLAPCPVLAVRRKASSAPVSAVPPPAAQRA
ncbi:MAG TPA: universal stress protein [Polyangiaceae bacterium]